MKILLDKRNQLNGRKITKQESNDLIKVFKEKIPKWFIEILLNFSITECEFNLSEEQDESGLGVSLKWMTPAQIISEATEVYPGIPAAILGYIPIGMCMDGSGDYYYMQFKNADPPLVRIPHEAVDRNEKLIEQQIEIVSPNLSQFLEIAELEIV